MQGNPELTLKYQMHFSKATVLAVVASIPLALGSPTLFSRQNGVTCQTSSGSPFTGDVTLVINELKGRGDKAKCAQTNDSASSKTSFHIFHHHRWYCRSKTIANSFLPECTTLVKEKTAAISVCGGEDDKNSALLCKDVADYANQIQQTCLNGPAGDANTRSGGTFTVSQSKRIVVINSKDT